MLGGGGFVPGGIAVAGPAGKQGAQGQRGAQGPAGPAGLQGVHGPQGPPGFDGPRGQAGIEGPSGPAGPPGTGIEIEGVVHDRDDLPEHGTREGEAWVTDVDSHVWFWGKGGEEEARWIDGGPLRGPLGPRGFEGLQGPDGAQGLLGSPGPEGPPGVQGLRGAPGDQGSIGPCGPPGVGVSLMGTVPDASALPQACNAVGNAWICADTGYLWFWDGCRWVDLGLVRGPQGPAGEQGPVGPEGPRGSQGPLGNQGLRGAEGPRGVEGPEGPAGTSVVFRGTVWYQDELPKEGNRDGDAFLVESNGHLWVWESEREHWADAGQIRGPRGLRGPEGIEGPPGFQGARGAEGPEGVRGPQGVAGAEGPIGPSGPAGSGVCLKGSVASQASLPTTCNRTCDAWITENDGHVWVWNGVAWVDCGPIRGPQGPAGVAGPEGARGPQGSEGVRGPEGHEGPRGQQGIEGPEGPEGPRGQDGTGVNIKGSVRDVDDLPTEDNEPGDGWIVETTGHLFVWSGDRWADAGEIRGPEGPRGPAGPEGERGPAGSQGVPGPAGSTGSIGPAGPTGATGPSGPAGSPGPEGERGDDGQDGPPGPAGAPGPPSPAGDLIAGTGINLIVNPGPPVSTTINAVPSSFFQTPWLSDIDGAFHSLNHVSNVSVQLPTGFTRAIQIQQNSDPTASAQIALLNDAGNGVFLHITGSASDQGNAYMYTESTDFYILNGRDSGFHLSRNGSISIGNVLGTAEVPIYLNPLGGNVGIATTMPQYTLDVAGDVNITGTGQYRINGVPIGGGDVTSVFGRTGAVVLQGSDISTAGGVLATRSIIAGAGLTGGGNLSVDRTLSVVPSCAMQSPWLCNINGANYSLTNVALVGIATASPTSGTGLELYHNPATNRSVVQSYNHNNNTYNPMLIEGTPVLINAQSLSNVGIGMATPRAVLSLGTLINSDLIHLYDSGVSVYGFGILPGPTLGIYSDATVLSSVQIGGRQSNLGVFLPTLDVQNHPSGGGRCYFNAANDWLAIVLRFNASSVNVAYLGVNPDGVFTISSATGRILLQLNQEGVMYYPSIPIFGDRASAQAALGEGTRAVFATGDGVMAVT